MRHAALWLALVTLPPACRCQTNSAPAARVTVSTSVAVPLTSGSITGTIRLAGELKEKLGVPAGGRQPVNRLKLRTVVLGEGRTLANVYVAVKSGPVNRDIPRPEGAVILRQVDRVYEPRVLGIMTDQVLKVRNEDTNLHNVNIQARFSALFNKGHSNKGDESDFKFTTPEIGITVKCDVHPWMLAWIHVSDHPFFAVTGVDGKYSIPGLPPGEYELLAWHERFQGEPLVAKVKVEVGKAATLDFMFEAPRK